MNIDSVVTECRERLHQMRDLNLRAGKEVFKAPTLEDLRQHFTIGLKSARCVAEIGDWNDLDLPALDQNLVNQVLSGCPDTITVLGVSMPVEYESRFGGVSPHPFVKLPPQLVSSRRWMELPDKGVHLPNGQAVAVCLSPDGYSGYLTETDMPTLKAKACELLNKGQWNQWKRPDLPQPMGAIAPVVERQYGRCVITGEPLMAYGTIRSGFGSLYTEWTRNQAEAEDWREHSCRRFAQLQEEAHRAELQKRAGELYRLHNAVLAADVRMRLREVVYGFTLQTAEEIKPLILEVEALIKPQSNADELGEVDLSRLFGGTARVKP